MAEEAEDQKTEQGDQSKKGGKKLLLIAGAIMLLVIAGGGVAAFVLLGKKDTKAEEAPADAAIGGEEHGTAEGSGEEPELEEGEEPLGAILPLDTFLVNLSGGKYVRVQIQVEFEDLDVPSRFYTRVVPIRDGIIALLTQHTADDLASTKGKETLKTKMKTLMNDLLRREEVKRIYFTQFVIQ